MSKRILIGSVIAAMSWLDPSCPAQEPPGESIRVGFFNTQFLPWSPFGGTQSGCCDDIPHRAEKMAARIRDGQFDVIALAEVFQSEAQETFVPQLRGDFPYYVQFIEGDRHLFTSPDTRLWEAVGATAAAAAIAPLAGGAVALGIWLPALFGDTAQDSGLMLFSKVPFAEFRPGWERYRPEEDDLTASAAGRRWRHVAFVMFTAATAGEDKLAMKGAGLVRILNPRSGRPINIVFTYLDAPGGKEIRKRQIEQIGAMVRAVVPDLPREDLLLLGDLNLNGDYARRDLADGEWTERFTRRGEFFTDVLRDQWEEQLDLTPLAGVVSDPCRNARDRGLTAGYYNRPSGLDNRVFDQTETLKRYDYLLKNRPTGGGNRPLCVQHMALAHQLLAPEERGEFSDAAFGVRGEAHLSDHFGIIADLNVERPHCSPSWAEVYRATPTTGGLPNGADEIVGLIDVPGGFSWVFVPDAGTYSITVVPDDPFAPPGFRFHPYSITNLSSPIRPLPGWRRDLVGNRSQHLAPGAFVFDTAHCFFIRVLHESREQVGRFRLLIRKHQGDSPSDAIPLVPDADPPRRFPPAGLAVTVGAANPRYFKFQAERATSGRPQRIRCFVSHAGPGAGDYRLELLQGGVPIAARPPLRVAFGGPELQIVDESVDGDQCFFLRVTPAVGIAPDYLVGWNTSLTVIHPFAADAAHDIRMQIVLDDPSDEPDKILGVNIEDDDDVRLQVEIARDVGVAPFPILFRSPRLPIVADWDRGHAEPVPESARVWKILPDERLIFRLLESDGGLRGEDDVIEVTIRGLGRSPDRFSRSFILSDIDCHEPPHRCDTQYRLMGVNLTHGLPLNRILYTCTTTP